MNAHATDQANGTNAQLVAPGWYQSPDDLPGQLRYHDGSRWTEHVHVSEQPNTAEPEREQRHRTGVRLNRATVALLAVVLVTVACLGAFTMSAGKFVEGLGAAHLEAGQAIDALPSAKQISDVMGMPATNPKRTAMTQKLFNNSDNGLCQFGSTVSPGFLGGENFDTETAKASVSVSVAVFESDQAAQDAYREMERRTDRTQACIEANANGEATMDRGEANGGLYFVANSKTSPDGSGGAAATSGNAFVMVSIDTRSGNVSADQLKQLQALALDSAKHPDAARR